MPTFAHAAGDDPLGLAVAGDIVLTNLTGPVLVKQLVDLLSEQGVPLKTSAVLIEGIYQITCNYELKSSQLVLPLNAAVGANGYRVQSVDMVNMKAYAKQIQATAVELGLTPSSRSKIKAGDPTEVLGHLEVVAGFVALGCGRRQPVQGDRNLEHFLAQH